MDLLYISSEHISILLPFVFEPPDHRENLRDTTANLFSSFQSPMNAIMNQSTVPSVTCSWAGVMPHSMDIDFTSLDCLLIPTTHQNGRISQPIFSSLPSSSPLSNLKRHARLYSTAATTVDISSWFSTQTYITQAQPKRRFHIGQ